MGKVALIFYKQYFTDNDIGRSLYSKIRLHFPPGKSLLRFGSIDMFGALHSCKKNEKLFL